MEYSLLIDQESLMPFVLKRTNILSQDEVTLTYTNITTKELILPEKGWYYSSYFPEFKLNNNTKTSLISTGTQAPDFQIKDISNDNIYSLSSSKSKVLLLEFFIKNCGYCVEAVSKLNKLQQQYKEKGLDILGINPYDSKENIRNFIANNNPDYKVTVNGQNVAEKYGVSFYPSVILIDRSGKVIFSGSFDEAKIDNVLKNLIKL